MPPRNKCFCRALVLIVVGLTTRIFFAAIWANSRRCVSIWRGRAPRGNGWRMSEACSGDVLLGPGVDPRNGEPPAVYQARAGAVCLGCGRRHWISTAGHASITRDALAGGSGCGVLRATSTARAAASCSPPAASSGGWSIRLSLTVRHGGKSGALPGLSSGRRSQPDPRTLRGVVLARWGEGNGPHAGRVGYSEGAVWDGFSGERTTAKGTGRGKGTRYRIRQQLADRPGI